MARYHLTILILLLSGIVFVVSNELRILGGQSIEEQTGQYPYMVALKRESFDGSIRHHFCGGVIIDKHWVLTAAQCISNYELDPNERKIFAHAGIINVRGDYLPANKNGVQMSRVIEKYDHRFYHPETKEHNLALLYLETPFTWTEYVKPAELPDVPLDRSQTVTILGWGPYNESDFGLVSSSFLRSSQVQINPYSPCNVTSFRPIGVTLDYVFCVGEYGNTACANDLGGPLISENSKLYGIASIIARICDGPAVYTNIQPYVTTFIKPLIDNRDTIKKNVQLFEKFKNPQFLPTRGDASFTVSIHSNPAGFPHVREKLCAGSFIKKQWIITAAHCLQLDRSNGNGLFIVQGLSTDWANANEDYSAEFIPVDLVFPHPDYKPGEVANDIALLYLKEPSSGLRHDIVKLPDNEGYQAQNSLRAAGFTITPGHNNFDLYGNGHLAVAFVKEAPKQECTKNLPDATEDNILCYSQKSSYPCIADSGGALFERQNLVLHGIHTQSYGRCGSHPEPFVRIAKHIYFINFTINSMPNPASNP